MSREQNRKSAIFRNTFRMKRNEAQLVKNSLCESRNFSVKNSARGREPFIHFVSRATLCFLTLRMSHQWRASAPPARAQTAPFQPDKATVVNETARRTKRADLKRECGAIGRNVTVALDGLKWRLDMLEALKSESDCALSREAHTMA